VRDEQAEDVKGGHNQPFDDGAGGVLGPRKPPGLGTRVGGEVVSADAY
jgi:hypothetical protein